MSKQHVDCEIEKIKAARKQEDEAFRRLLELGYELVQESDKEPFGDLRCRVYQQRGYQCISDGVDILSGARLSEWIIPITEWEQLHTAIEELYDKEDSD